MSSVGTVISYPIPAYSNVPIEAQFYQPSRFVISAISLGITTIVTTSLDNNYVVGQLVRLLIPAPYGSFQLNNVQGYVISLPASNQVEIGIDSSLANAYVSNPFVATITGATQATDCVLTVNQSVYGSSVLIQNVGGMTQLNNQVIPIITQRSNSITLNVNSSSYSAYTSGGTATAYPIDGRVAQIIALGDVNSGASNSNGRVLTSTQINGSFINISPN